MRKASIRTKKILSPKKEREENQNKKLSLLTSFLRVAPTLIVVIC